MVFTPNPGILARMCFCSLIHYRYILQVMNRCNATRVYKINPITWIPITKINARITPILARIEMSDIALKLQICRLGALQVICNICLNNDFCPQAVFEDNPGSGRFSWTSQTRLTFHTTLFPWRSRTWKSRVLGMSEESGPERYTLGNAWTMYFLRSRTSKGTYTIYS